MSLPDRFAPPTQMDALRALLAAYVDHDRGFEAQLHRSLQGLRELALPELGRRLARTTTPRGLRLALLDATGPFDWPEWDVHLMHLLQPEEDLGLFDHGVAALGGLCTPRAYKWLLRLRELRRDSERQAMLARELSLYQTGHPFETGLDLVRVGEGQPDVARLGARSLAVHLATPDADEARRDGLVQAFHEGDPLTRHLALRLLAFLTDATSDAALVALFEEATDGPADSRAREALDDIASLLAARVEAGKVPLESALPMLERAFHAGLGGEGLMTGYLRLVDPEDKGRLDKLVADPNVARKCRCIEVLGAREEDKLVPFFVRAMNDPAHEVAQLAVRQFGKLPSGAPAMMKLFRSEQPDQVRLAVRFFGENRVLAAAKPLMGLLPQDAADDLVLDSVRALGAIGDPAATKAFLGLLHDGKPLLLQLALVEALGRLRTPEASLGLLKKAEGLKIPQVLHLALDGVLAAFPDFEHPFPAEAVPALEALVARCCDPREGEGQWLRTGLTLTELFTLDAEAYRRLKDRFADHLLTAKPRTPTERQETERLQEGLHVFLRRAVGLSEAGDREAALAEAMAACEGDPGGRMAVLDQMWDALNVPEPVLSEPFAKTFAAFLSTQLGREGLEPAEALRLCALAGASRLRALVEPLREAYAHAATPAVQAAAHQAARTLGLADHEIQRRPPIHAVHLLEPNAFFRKRLTTALEQPGRTLTTSGGRGEAEAFLAENPVDLLISETHDEAGDLGHWLQSQWERHRVKLVLLSTANHDLGTLAGRPWVLGRLYKPYPLDEVTRVLEG